MMKEFNYKVSDKHNNKFSNTITALNKQDAIKVLTSKGFKVISLNEIKLNFFKSFLLKYNTRKMTIKDRNFFFKQLYSYLKIGYNVKLSLDFISQNKINKPIFKNLAHQLLQDIDKGNSLGDVLVNYGFPKDICSIVKSGERIGNLKETIKLLVDRNELANKVSKGFKSVFMLSAILVPTILFLSIGVLKYLVPKFKTGMVSIAGSADKIPPHSKLIFYMSDNVVLFSILLFSTLFGLIGLFFSIYYSNKSFKMYISKKILSINILGSFIYYKEMASITSIMALAYGAGYTNDEIVDISRNQIKNAFIKSQFDEIYKLVNRNGYSVSEAMSLAGFDPAIYSLIQIGEISGRKDVISSLNHLTNEFSDLTLDNLKNMESFKSSFNTIILTIFTLPIIWLIITPQMDQMKLALARTH